MVDSRGRQAGRGSNEESCDGITYTASIGTRAVVAYFNDDGAIDLVRLAHRVYSALLGKLTATPIKGNNDQLSPIKTAQKNGRW
jgi:hypothetical protein